MDNGFTFWERLIFRVKQLAQIAGRNSGNAFGGIGNSYDITKVEITFAADHANQQ